MKGLPNVHPVDVLGDIVAQIDILEGKRTVAKEAVVKLGLGPHNGADYSANVYEAEKSTLDQKAVEAKLISLIGLRAARAWIKRHTKKSPYVAVRTDLIVKTVTPSPASLLKAS